MIKYKNDCCGCANATYPCLGSSCPKRNVPHYYCDECGDEFDGEELCIWDDDSHLCKECLFDKYRSIL